MIEEGSQVRLRQSSEIARLNPEMADAVGIVGRVIKGPAWGNLGVSMAERVSDTAVHVRFRTMNLVALNVPVSDVEPMDYVAPEPFQE